MKTKILILVSVFASFANAQFAPIPTLQEKPWRFFIGATESLGFDPLRHTQSEVKASLTHKLCSSFDAGVALHGGFGASPNYPGVLGLDIMGRYLKNLNSWMFGGVQIMAGYTYNGLGLSSRSATIASNIPITLGPVVGYTASPSVRIYLFPALELGRKNYATEKDFWGTQVGFQIGLGAAIKLGTPVLSVEVKPRYSNQNQFCLDATAALVWNF